MVKSKKINVLPFTAPKYPDLSERGLIARLEHVLKEIRAARYRRLNERMRYLVEQIGMSIDDAQEAVSATSPYLENITFFEEDDAESVKLKPADKAKIARRAKKLHDGRQVSLPNLKWLRDDAQLEAIYAASRGVDIHVEARGGGMSWPIAELDEVVTFLDYMRKPVKKSDRRAGPYPYYGANGQQGTIDGFIFDEPLVLLAEDGGHFDNPERGVAYRVEGKCWVNNHAHVLRANKRTTSEYLAAVLRNLPLKSYITGTTRAKLTKAAAKRIEIPLPPLDEQRRIAGILDAADALRRRRREALALLDTLPGAIFAEMFGDLTTSELFSRGPLSDLVKGFDTGKNLAPAPDEVGTRHRVLKVSAVTKGEFIEAESKPLPADYAPPASHFVKPGDLLFSRANTSDLIGATALVGTVSDNIVLPDKIWRFLFDDRKADPIFVHYLFGSRKFRDELSRRATGSSGSMKNISKGKVLSIEVGKPTIEAQKKFSKRVTGARQLRMQISEHLTELETLFASLQSRAFAGAL